jgi:sialidase-1
VTVKGTLLAFCEGRKGSLSDAGDIDIVLRRSTDNGQTWDAPHILVDDGADTCGNPCPVVDRGTGVIWLPLTKNKGDAAESLIMKGEAPPRTVWISKSEDDGLTWSNPVEITASVRKPDWRWYATGPGHGIQLADGRLVVPCNHAVGPGDDAMHSHVIFSLDPASAWQIGGVEEGKTDESTVVELADGSLYHNMRNYRGTHRRAFATSTDKGMTWSPVAEDPALVEPTCQASAVRLSTKADGEKDRVLFSNPASERRENLTVRLSYDECKTWPVAKTLHPGPAAYSDLAILPDKTIVCLFERGAKTPYETITCARFTLDWLTDGKDHF